jgi:Fe-S-cluster-containing hydrogenase component 2
LCVTACVGAHDDGAFSTHLARLHIDPVKLGQHKVMFCTLCKKCLDVCPTGALRWHDTTGAVELIVEKCTACEKCVGDLPARVIERSDTAVRFSGTELPWYPIVCDLCGDRPARIWPAEAIYIDERKRFPCLKQRLWQGGSAAYMSRGSPTGAKQKRLHAAAMKHNRLPSRSYLVAYHQRDLSAPLFACRICADCG